MADSFLRGVTLFYAKRVESFSVCCGAFRCAGYLFGKSKRLFEILGEGSHEFYQIKKEKNLLLRQEEKIYGGSV